MDRPQIIWVERTVRRLRRRRSRRYGRSKPWAWRHGRPVQKAEAPDSQSVLQYGYRPANKGLLLTPTESSFYDVLKQAVGEGLDIHAKVRVADVLEPNVSRRWKFIWRLAFNRIKAKHFDFVLCDPKTFEVKLAVELRKR